MWKLFSIVLVAVVVHADQQPGNHAATLPFDVPAISLHLPQEPADSKPNGLSTWREMFAMVRVSSWPKISNDYRHIPNLGAYKLHPYSATWNEARKICRSEGAHLAVINSEREAQALSDIVKKTPATMGKAISLGYHDMYKRGEFVTIFDETLAEAGYNQWGPNEPNNSGGNEHCGSMFRDGKLNDIPCNSECAFFCEISIPK